ncbi:autophagy-related protein 22-like protein [Auriculariales sp. MPI-PUGE-AT-0066]|nr:autophagy-related protein 22-like protein [Auriculariales sp. MPI-PUGE-AT-0066]
MLYLLVRVTVRSTRLSSFAHHDLLARPSSSEESVFKPPAATNASEAAALDAKVVPELDDNGKKTGKLGASDLGLVQVDYDGPIVTRRELWSYYLYYNGNNGVGPLGFSSTLFQSLAFSAGWDPAKGNDVRAPCDAPDASGQCVLPWAGGTKQVASVVLIANGLCFTAMTLLFTTLGSAADYGTFGRWLLFVVTIVCWASQFASVSLTSPSMWPSAMALFMLSFTTYGATLVFYAALFPRLARNTPRSRELRRKLEDGEISAENFEKEESLEKNRISNISTMHSNIGYLFVLLLDLSILLPLADHPRVNNYTIVLTNAYWVVTGIWWFIFQQPRPGPRLPKGEHYVTIGWKQIWSACKQYKRLPYTFIYLFAFFLLADGLNTTGTLVGIIQNETVHFSFLTNTYYGICQAITSTISTYGFWVIQNRFKLNTKTMFVVTNIATVLIPFWGMLGLWTNKIGFHHTWEFWFYNAFFGVFQAPYYAFSQTMMAEVTPPGFDNMFFGLFGLSNRASSMIGPNVIQAIIDNTGNKWMGFPFLFALCAAAALVIWFGVDIEKGRSDAVKFAVERRVDAAGVIVDERDSSSGSKDNRGV